MKKLLILFIAVLLSQVSFGQYNVIQNIGSPSTLVQVPANGGLKSLFINRPLADTTEANTTNIKYYPGAQFFASGDTAIWLRNSTATKWIQLFSNSSGSSGDTLVWKLSGNAVATRSVAPVLGTTTADNLNFITDGQQRMIIPSAGITRNGAAVNKYLLIDTITHSLFYGDGGSSTPNLLQVTAVDSVTSHKVGIGSITSNLIGRLHIQTPNLLNTPNDSSGLYLQNPTAATTTNRVQMSPSVVWEGYAWKNTGSLSQKHLWRADVMPVNSTAIPSISKWRLSVNPAAAGYFSAFEVTQAGISTYSSTGVFSTVNSVQLGSVTQGLYYGTSYPTTSTGTVNLSIGSSTLASLTSGSNNVAIGAQALNADTSGGINTAVGHYALKSNTNGEQNVGVGFNALFANTTGIKNTAVGAGSMEGNRTGGFNTGIGHDALLHVTTGNQNVGLGWLAGSLDSTSSDNTSIGTSSARSMIGGSRNVMVGSQAGYNASQLVAANHSIGLGYGAYTRADYQFALSDSITRMKAQGMGRGVVGYALIDTTGNGDIALKSLATYGTNIYNSDGTLTGDRTVNANGNYLIFSGASEVALNATNGVTTTQFEVLPTYSITQSIRGINQSTFSVYPDSISIKPGQALLYIDSLTQGTSTDSLLSWQPSTGLVRKIDPARITASITASNGLTKSGSDIKLGGRLTASTTISGANSYALTLDSLSALTMGSIGTIQATSSNGSGFSWYNQNGGTTTISSNITGSAIEISPDSTRIRGDAGFSVRTGTFDETRMVIDASGNVGINTNPGTTTLSVAGSLALGYVEKTTTYVVAASDYTINCTSGTFTVTLPTAVGITGRVYVIKNTGAGTITIDGDGTETIDGSLTQALNIQYASLTVQSTGTGWIIL